MFENNNDNGKSLSKVLQVIHHLGGWTLASIVFVIASKFVWDDRARTYDELRETNEALVAEIRNSRKDITGVVRSNTEAITDFAASQKAMLGKNVFLADKMEELITEVRTNTKAQKEVLAQKGILR